MRLRPLTVALGGILLGAAAAAARTVRPEPGAGVIAWAGTPAAAARADTPTTVARADTAMVARAATTPAMPAAAAAQRTVARNLLDEQTEQAVQALSGQVTQRSDPNGLGMAFRAYYAYRAAHPEQVRKPYLYYVDYGLDSRTRRGYVFDMDALTRVDGPFMVAHGRGSSTSHYGVPTRFSNAAGAATSSLGLYLTQESYAFTGHAGSRPYASVGLRLTGLSGRFNDAARARGVVMHGAPYVGPSGAGRSQGCPAVEPDRARRLIPLIAGGSLVFLYSPLDTAWVRGDPWANAAGGVTVEVPATGAAAPASTPATPPSSR